MDSRHFDALTRVLSAGNARRRLLALLVTLPLVGGLSSFFGPEDTAAKGRRKRRKKRHKHGKGRRRTNRRGKGKPQPICTPACAGKCGGASDGCGGTCTGGCAASQICDQQACQGCDVCASGCAHATVQPAIDAASAGGTVRICAGTYARDEDDVVVNITKSLTLVGAGAGANGTTLHGNHSLTLWPVVLVSGATNTVFLRDLRVTGGNNDFAPGGIELFASVALTLTGVLVTGNHADRGAGILNNGTLTLGAGTTVTGNTALSSGGGIFNNATLILDPGSSVSGNLPDQCVNNGVGSSGCPG